MKKEKVIKSLALSLTKGIGSKVYKRLIDNFKSADQVFNSSIELLLKKGNVSEAIAHQILNKNAQINEAEKIYEKNKKENIKIIPYESWAYPKRLRDIYDIPKILYTKGNFTFESRRIVSIVGTRNASLYGIRWVKNFVKKLKPYAPIIVSGLAHGIDFYAHEEALKGGLSTMGVLGGGLDSIYPEEHSDLANRMLKCGGLVSEYSAGIPTERYNFPARNRIIVGMSDAVVVVEAGQKSGALITAAYANAVDKDVFALPGAVDSQQSIGCNELIKSHKAHLITSAEDFLYMMNWNSVSNKSENKVLNINGLPKTQKSIVSFLDDYGIDVGLDLISTQVNLMPSQVSRDIFELQKKNMIESVPGNKYRLLA